MLTKIVVLVVLTFMPNGTVKVQNAGQFASAPDCQIAWSGLAGAAVTTGVNAGYIAGVCVTVPWTMKVSNT